MFALAVNLALNLNRTLRLQVLPPWTPDRSPAADSDGDERATLAAPASKPSPSTKRRSPDPAAPADRSDALVQQLISLSRPAVR